MKEKNSILKKFGSKLKALRTEQNLTQEQLALKGNFNRNYIGMLERGERNPSLLSLMRLSETLNVELKYLMDF